MQILRSIVKLFLIAAVAATSTGCTGLILRDLVGSKEFRDIETSRTSDELIAIGKISNQEVLTQFPEAIALIGINQSYILLKGAKELQSISNLDGHYLKAIDSNNRELAPNSPLLFKTKDKEFFGTARFIYNKKNHELSDAEKLIISKIQHKSTNFGHTVIGINISGIIPDGKITGSDAVKKFKVGREIALIKTESREKWIRYPNPLAIFALPYAIIGDAILLPILLLANNN
jgi:hypothetical protein